MSILLRHNCLSGDFISTTSYIIRHNTNKIKYRYNTNSSLKQGYTCIEIVIISNLKILMWNALQ